MTEHDGYTEMAKRQPCADGCPDCPHGTYLYHVREEKLWTATRTTTGRFSAKCRPASINRSEPTFRAMIFRSVETRPSRRPDMLAVVLGVAKEVCHVGGVAHPRSGHLRDATHIPSRPKAGGCDVRAA